MLFTSPTHKSHDFRSLQVYVFVSLTNPYYCNLEGGAGGGALP